MSKTISVNSGEIVLNSGNVGYNPLTVVSWRE
jgi:hypothetical protein